MNDKVHIRAKFNVVSFVPWRSATHLLILSAFDPSGIPQITRPSHHSHHADHYFLNSYWTFKE